MSSISPTTNVSNRLPTTALMVAIHSLLWIALLLGLLLWIPHAEMIFRDFNVKLPTVTEWAVALARWVSTYPLLGAISLFLLLSVDGLIYYRLLSSTRRFGSEVWSAIMVLLPGLVIALTAIGFLNALLLLVEGLKKALTN